MLPAVEEVKQEQQQEEDNLNSIETPPEVYAYQTEYNETDKQLEQYLSEKYKKEIDSFTFFPTDILIRYVMGYRHVQTDYDFENRKRHTEELFAKYLNWHKRAEYDTITAKLSEQEIQTLAPDIFFYGNDKYGHPIVYNTGIRYRKDGDVSIFKDEETDEFSPEMIDKYVSFVLKKVHELKIKNTELYKVNEKCDTVGIYQMVIIVDATEFSVKNFFYERKMYEYMTSLVNVLTPDTLHRVYVINAPWLFTTVWNVLKHFIHPVTVEKTQILGKDYIDVITQEIDIRMIPPQYGGQGKWDIKYGGVPQGF